jgi:hypothetical protein
VKLAPSVTPATKASGLAFRRSSRRASRACWSGGSASKATPQNRRGDGPLKHDRNPPHPIRHRDDPFLRNWVILGSRAQASSELPPVPRTGGLW